jgi:4-hydroxy 2-oxovalerate aldolase
MKNIKVLDCTLRDGGFVIDMNFGHHVIIGIIEKLHQANIDFIECGFLKDVEYKDGITLFQRVEQISQFLPENRKKNISFVALLDYGRYSLENLIPYNGLSIDGIRICFVKEDDIKAVMEYANKIIEKGYKVYLQPTAILSYTDTELLHLLEEVEKIKPYAFSIVDTFGSMYEDDLLHIYTIVDKNLSKEVNLGFHSHNNLQLSFALCQKFIQISRNRNIFVDSSICGLGRGAGNTCTELIINYLNERFEFNYDFNIILDIIDIYMPNIMRKGKWGYSIPFMIAGKLNSHVNNISYLLDKHNINSNDLLQIISKIDSKKRRKYDYNNLWQLYIEYFNNSVDDEKNIIHFKQIFSARKILLIAPGRTIETQKGNITAYIAENNPVIIDINTINPYFNANFVFFSSNRRFQKAQMESKTFGKTSKIITSNIKTALMEDTYIINYDRLIKSGWKNFDSSIILLLRFLDIYTASEIAIAGVDGFISKYNYIANMDDFEPIIENEKYNLMNQEIDEMLIDFLYNRKQTTSIKFITDSIFSNIFIRPEINGKI